LQATGLPSESSNFAALAAWYADQCDGEWEHRYGVSIQSIDNPGWWVKVDLTGTPLAARAFEAVSDGVALDGVPGSRWLRCYVEDGVWNGAGDTTRLDEIVGYFVAWSKGGS
jgi:hypothetical protein